MRNRTRTGNTTTGNNRRHRHRKNVPSKLTRTPFMVDGGTLEVVTGPLPNVKGYLHRTKDKLAISAIGLSTMLKQAIVTAIVFKSDKGGIFNTKSLIPDTILNEVYQAATYYNGMPIRMGWLRLFGDLDHQIRVASFDADIFNHSVFKDDRIRDNFNPVVTRFLKTFGFLFKDGLLRGHTDTNTLVLTAPYNPEAVRQTYVWNDTNFAPLPIVTDKVICQSVFGKNLLLQAERGHNMVFGLTSQSIRDFLSYKVGQPVWTKVGKINDPIIELSSIPVGFSRLIVTTRVKTQNSFQLISIVWDDNIPVLKFDRKISATGLAPIIRTDLSGLITYGNEPSDNDRVSIYPVDQLGPEFAGLITTPPTTVTPPNVM